MRRVTAVVAASLLMVALLPSPMLAQGQTPPAPPSLATIINGGVDIVAARALPLLMAMAAIGVLTMAILQVVKETWQLQAKFNRRHFRRWSFRGSARARADLIMLATGGDDRALFELPIPGMAAQMSMAARAALA